MNKVLSTSILGIKVSTETEEEIIRKIIKRLKATQYKGYIVTPNPEIIMFSLKDREYKEVLNRAQFALPDGIGVLIASKLLKNKVLGRITGVDFMKTLVRQCAKEGLTTGFFGGAPGVAEKVADCLQKSYPNLKVSYASSVWDSNKIKGNKIDILFVALGFPKQEKWIAKNLDDIPVKYAMGVGGAFDLISGKVRRAPKIVRDLGLEWLFRLIIQPWRIKRQLVLPQFIFHILMEKLSLRK